jgi:hypothetical protein
MFPKKNSKTLKIIPKNRGEAKEDPVYSMSLM